MKHTVETTTSLDSPSAGNAFEVDIPTDLRARTAIGMSFALAAQICKFIMQIASMVILARLLTPSDFGLVAMAMVLAGLVQVVANGGLSTATVQRPSITEAQASSLFWINASLGVSLSVLLILTAPLIASLYREQQLTDICFALSALFLITGLTVQAEALLRRQMRFRELALIDVAAMAAGVSTAIGAAFAGLGYWALVLMSIVAAAVRLVMVWLANGWRPGIPAGAEGLGDLLRFGAHVTGASLVGALATNVTPFAVALIGGPSAAGLFNRAAALSSLPTSQFVPALMAVAQPALARVAADQDRFRRGALSLVGKTCMLGAWLTVTMMACSDLIVLNILGPSWGSAIEMFRILAVFALVETTAGTVSSLLVAGGHASALFRWKIYSLVIIVGSLLIGSFWGTRGIVIAYSISGLIIRFPSLIFLAAAYLPISARELFGSMFGYIAVAATTFFALLALRVAFPDVDGLVGLAMLVSVSAAAYGFGLLALPGTRGHLLDVIHTIGSVLRNLKLSIVGRIRG
ncbi:lipopolysaccharide biosynthesis protein [Mesorhizobium sp.]|uniref:lipopolysaccharide biosynthesis protein n=1 Tax=Mesorhizobium sp. TaxID=1871066 RepID=UPI0012016AFB|nr:lipopolysaccharide biosynthesis protein [Mesorhizobium sp.]TIN26423.1 MAG: lipopolysaccharide biosynthesis protein [Mesorhizobium sp.]